MSDTIFYELKLKPRKKPADVFVKIQRSVKPKGVTKNWTCEFGENWLIINFGDGKSETFALSFEKGAAKGFCKVYFPLEGELFEDAKKSEWKAFLGIFDAVRSLCAYFSVTDDYDIAEEYLEGLKYKFDMRELTVEEQTRLDRLFESGFNKHEALLLAVYAEDLGLDYNFDRNNQACAYGILRNTFPPISALWENYLCRTSLFKKKTLREVYVSRDRYNIDLSNPPSGDPPAEVYTFALGVGALFKDYEFHLNRWGRGANVTGYFIDKFIPVFNSSDDYHKCALAFQFMLSVYDYCKFKFVGTEEAARMLEEYESRLREFL